MCASWTGAGMSRHLTIWFWLSRLRCDLVVMQYHNFLDNRDITLLYQGYNTILIHMMVCVPCASDVWVPLVVFISKRVVDYSLCATYGYQLSLIFLRVIFLPHKDTKHAFREIEHRFDCCHFLFSIDIYTVIIMNLFGHCLVKIWCRDSRNLISKWLSMHLDT